MDLPELIKQVDSRYPSPEERASQVWAVIKQHAPTATDWDLLCFSAEFVGLMSQQWTWLPSKELLKMVYTAHYNFADKFLGEGNGNSEPEKSDLTKRNGAYDPNTGNAP